MKHTKSKRAVPRVEREPALFAHYPELKGRIPWIALGSFPTRVHRLAHLGHGGLWIKREDESSPLYGGNKVRKLEFTLADAMRQGKTRVVTMGGVGTNHGLATAVFCNHLGLECTLLLFKQPVTRYVRQNLLLFHKYGARLAYKKSILKTGIAFYTTERLFGNNSYFLYAGGSSPLGTLGSLSALFELKQQIDEGRIPLPRYIFCPLGSNGTMAGLSLGVLLAGLETTVIGVRVGVERIGPMGIASEEKLRALMRQTHLLLKRHARSVPDVDIPPQRIIHDYFGGGYGFPTEKCIEAMELMRKKERIRLDPTYTAKTFAAVLDFARDPSRKNDTILYWHTYNSVDLSKEARALDYRSLPEELHWVFREEEIPL